MTDYGVVLAAVYAICLLVTGRMAMMQITDFPKVERSRAVDVKEEE